MMEFATESLLGIESDPARLNWMAGPLFPSFTGSVPLPLMDRLPGIESDGANSQALSLEKCRKQLLLATYSNGQGPLFLSFTGSVLQDSSIQLVSCTRLLEALA